MKLKASKGEDLHTDARLERTKTKQRDPPPRPPENNSGIYKPYALMLIGGQLDAIGSLAPESVVTRLDGQKFCERLERRVLHTHLDTVDAVLVGGARTLQQLRVQLPVGCEELEPHRLLVPADEEVHRRSREVPEHLWS